uniref:Uncharacterized protein n=2 Tax=Amphimedon queenslandica TaxID=400682 RepID=A0A1X7TGU4_AMPQE
MLLGRKTDPAQDECLKKLEDISESTNTIERKIMKIEQELEGIEKGYCCRVRRAQEDMDSSKHSYKVKLTRQKDTSLLRMANLMKKNAFGGDKHKTSFVKVSELQSKSQSINCCYITRYILLDVLADRKSKGGLTGIVLVNGRPQPKYFKCMSGYVVQYTTWVHQRHRLFHYIAYSTSTAPEVSVGWLVSQWLAVLGEKFFVTREEMKLLYLLRNRLATLLYDHCRHFAVFQCPEMFFMYLITYYLLASPTRAQRVLSS